MFWLWPLIMARPQEGVNEWISKYGDPRTGAITNEELYSRSISIPVKRRVAVTGSMDRSCHPGTTKQQRWQPLLMQLHIFTEYHRQAQSSSALSGMAEGTE